MKKILSLLLAAAMLFSLLPATVLAVEPIAPSFTKTSAANKANEKASIMSSHSFVSDNILTYSLFFDTDPGAEEGVIEILFKSSAIHFLSLEGGEAFSNSNFNYNYLGGNYITINFDNASDVIGCCLTASFEIDSTYSSVYAVTPIYAVIDTLYDQNGNEMEDYSEMTDEHIAQVNSFYTESVLEGNTILHRIYVNSEKAQSSGKIDVSYDKASLQYSHIINGEPTSNAFVQVTESDSLNIAFSDSSELMSGCYFTLVFDIVDASSAKTDITSTIVEMLTASGDSIEEFAALSHTCCARFTMLSSEMFFIGDTLRYRLYINSELGQSAGTVKLTFDEERFYVSNSFYGEALSSSFVNNYNNYNITDYRTRCVSFKNNFDFPLRTGCYIEFRLELIGFATTNTSVNAEILSMNDASGNDIQEIIGATDTCSIMLPNGTGIYADTKQAANQVTYRLYVNESNKQQSGKLEFAYDSSVFKPNSIEAGEALYSETNSNNFEFSTDPSGYIGITFDAKENTVSSGCYAVLIFDIIDDSISYTAITAMFSACKDYNNESITSLEGQSYICTAMLQNENNPISSTAIIHGNHLLYSFYVNEQQNQCSGIFEVNYNSSTLHLNEIIDGDALYDALVASNTSTPGFIKTAFAGRQIVPTARYCMLDFTISSSNLSETSITFSISEFLDDDARPVELEGESITHTVSLPNTHTVSFVDSITNEVFSKVAVKDGFNTVYPIAPLHTGYSFVKWDFEEMPITQDTTITAIYKKNESNIVTFWDSVTDEAIASVEVPNGEDVTFPEPPVHEDYTFVKWDSDGKNITEDITITAIYSQQHTVTFINGITNEIIATVEVLDGEDVTFPEPPVHEGYTFVKWDSDGKNITEDITITAIYSQQHTVTLVDGLTNEIIATVKVNHGEDVSFPAAPEHEGYSFVNWDSDGKNVTEDITITAVYSENPTQNTLSLGDANGDGKVNTGDATYVLKFIVGSANLSDPQFVAADYNKDGKVNTGDAVAILKFIASR